MIALGFTEGTVGPRIVEAVQSRGFRVLYASSLLPVLAIDTPSLDVIASLPFTAPPYEARVGTYSWVDDLCIPVRLLRRKFLRGVGVKVGIVDSGLSLPRTSAVPDAIAEMRDFTGTGMKDSVGHGTFVAEIIHECARDARLYVAKAGDMQPHELLMLEALDWCASKGVNVINISAGMPAPGGCQGTCAICGAVASLRRRGVVVTVAAGNSGPAEDTIACPGNSPSAITVGAYDRKKKAVAEYSSVGRPDQAKPDLVCSVPRVHNASGVLECGTSFASPVIAGIIAACMTHYGGDDIVKALIGTARDLGAPRHVQGAGCLDLERMLEGLTNAGHAISADQQ